MERRTSEVTGLPRTYYDRSKPFEARVRFYNFYQPKTFVLKPAAYIIQQGWWKVIDRLKSNHVKMQPLGTDTVIEVEMYRIEDYKTSSTPYEGHRLNSDVAVTTMTKKISFRKGDFLIPMNQEANRYLIEVLEPHAPDSYFAWNFFDGILSQKEGFSDYAFEATAMELLNNDADLKKKFELRKSNDTAFARSGNAQLNFIYQQSPYYEPSHLTYPVYRVMQ